MVLGMHEAGHVVYDKFIDKEKVKLMEHEFGAWLYAAHKFARLFRENKGLFGFGKKKPGIIDLTFVKIEMMGIISHGGGDLSDNYPFVVRNGKRIRTSPPPTWIERERLEMTLRELRELKQKADSAMDAYTSKLM